MIPKVLNKTVKEKSSQADINNPSLDSTSLVFKNIEHVNQESYFAALEKGPFEKSQRGNSSPSSEQDSKTGGLDSFWARLQEKGISKTASDLISKSKRPNSNANFELSSRKWDSWCARRETDSFSSNINEILDYLADLYKQGLQYRTINNHRSAISAFHEQIQGKPVGEHPRVCALLARIFNTRAPQPKYCFIWNVQTVIEFIRKEWGRNQELSDKFLTYKLTMLLALTSASRALGLQHLSITFMVKIPSSFTFTFHKLHKAWKKGKSPPSVVFHSFKEDISLCVVEVLNKYLKRSEKSRTSDECQLLLSFVQPHKPVVSSTISGWIKKVLTILGGDVGVLKVQLQH